MARFLEFLLDLTFDPHPKDANWRQWEGSACFEIEKSKRGEPYKSFQLLSIGDSHIDTNGLKTLEKGLSITAGLLIRPVTE